MHEKRSYWTQLQLLCSLCHESLKGGSYADSTALKISLRIKRVVENCSSRNWSGIPDDCKCSWNVYNKHRKKLRRAYWCKKMASLKDFSGKSLGSLWFIGKKCRKVKLRHACSLMLGERSGLHGSASIPLRRVHWGVLCVDVLKGWMSVPRENELPDEEHVRKKQKLGDSQQNSNLDTEPNSNSGNKQSGRQVCSATLSEAWGLCFPVWCQRCLEMDA